MVRLFFAGTESQGGLFSDIITNRMISFYYSDDLDEQFWGNVDDYDRIMADSGAHSFFSSEGIGVVNHGEQGHDKDPVEYTHKYCRWLKKHEDDLDFYVELDIDKIIGWEKQLELRSIFDDYGLDPLLVWHPTNKQSFRDFCKEHDHVGIGSSDQGFEFVSDKLRIAEEEGTKCHLFAFTSHQKLEALTGYDSLFSVDSSTWTYGARFGQFFQFKRGQLNQYDADKFSEKFGRNFNELPRNKIMRWNASQWEKFNDYLT